MSSKAKLLCLAAVLGLVSASAFAVSPYGNTSQKGSLLIFPLIDVTDGRDTLIRITNDFTRAVTLKCYYQATDSSDYRVKYRNDFTFDLTRTQPAHWWARTGRSAGYARSGFTLRPFANLTYAGPAGIDGTVSVKKIERGELKCWAMSEDLQTPISHNHLTGTATVFDFQTGQAFEYNSSSFQALPLDGAPGTPVGTVNAAERSAKLGLNGLPGNYDFVPRMTIGNFTPVGKDFDGIGTHWVKLYLSGGRQDLAQGAPAVVTKYAFTFFNQDESQYTGEHVCGDSWIDIWLGDFYSATYSALKTDSAFYRVESIADKIICGDDAEAVGMVGVQVQGVTKLGLPVEGSTTPESEDVLVRAVPTHGRGSIAGEIAFDLDADPAEVKR